MNNQTNVNRNNPFDRDIDDPSFAISYDPYCKVCGEREDLSVGLDLRLDGGICEDCVEHYVSGRFWNLNAGSGSVDFDKMVFNKEEDDGKYRPVKVSGYLCGADLKIMYREKVEISFNDKYVLTAGICQGSRYEDTVKRLKSAIAFRRWQDSPILRPMSMTFVIDFFDRADDKYGLPWYWQGFIREIIT